MEPLSDFLWMSPVIWHKWGSLHSVKDCRQTVDSAKIACAESSHFIFWSNGYIDKNIFSGRNKFIETTNVTAPTLREQQTALPASTHNKGMMAIQMPLDKMVAHLRSFKDSHPLTTSCIYKIPVPVADCTLVPLAVRFPLGYWNTPETPG